ncbi:MAG: hypothetical protein ACLFTK_02895 [Anaerolineales bacterium]
MLNYRFGKWLINLLLVASLLAPLHISAQSDDQRAGLLRVTQWGVEIQRAGTSEWLRLREGATTPVGVGDQVRTDRLGRALIRLEHATLLLLPASGLAVTRYQTAPDGRAEVTLQQTGRTVQHIPFPGQFVDYRVVAQRGELANPRGYVALDARPDTRTDYVVAANGAVDVLVDEQTIRLTRDQGLRLAQTPSEVIHLPEAPTINFARIEGWLDGCAGRINTDGRLLRLRAGPGDDFFYMGNIRNETPVQIMGQAPGPGGLWYRIQYLSDFGWVLAELVTTDCTALREYPRDGVENAPGIVRWRARELPLLLPFYGLPDDDVWFYRR